MLQPDIDWNWRDASYNADWHEPTYSILARYIPPGSRILEIGAGGSHTIGALAARSNCIAYGVEPDIAGLHKTIELARDESADVTMIQGDGFQLPFASESFDVVYSLGLIEHFSKVECSRLLGEHYRVLRSDGIAIISVPNLLNFPHTLRKLLLGSRYEYYPERSFTPGQLRRTVASAGFRPISDDGILPLWGLAMVSGAWRIIAVLDRLGISGRLNGLSSPNARAVTGYMSYVVAGK